MDGLFIVGVDTGVGKSVICAGLMKLLYGSRKVCYWKPIQTATIVSDDTVTLKKLLDLPEDCFMPPAYRFAEPLSPYMAAKKWGKKIEIDTLTKALDERKKQGYFVIAEGAGGLLVPFNETELQIHLLKQVTNFGVIFVSEDRVGAINQTLLTVNAAREAKLNVLGVVLTKSRRTFGNAESISHFGRVEILAEFDPVDDARTLVAQVGGHNRLRKLLGITPLPV